MGDDRTFEKQNKIRGFWYHRIRARFWNAKGLLSIAFGGIFVLGLIALTPKLLSYNNLRKAHKLLAEGELAVKNEEWEKASESFGKAFMTAPSDPSTIRGIANFLRKIGGDPERTLFFWRQLVSLNVATDDDRINMAGALLLTGKSTAARQTMLTISEAGRRTKNYLEVEASILLAEGRQVEAERTMRTALLLDPHDPDSQLKLASMDLRNPLSEIQDEAIKVLWKLTEGSNKTAQLAIEILAKEARTSKEQYIKLLELSDRKSSSNDRLRFSVLSKFISKFPEEKDTLLGEQEKKASQLPIENRLTYFLMLQEIGEHERLLKQMPFEQVRQARELFAVYAESMAARGKWTELRNEIKKAASLPASQMDISLLLARCSKSLNESDKVTRGYLLEAARIAISSRDNRTIQRVCQIMSDLGHPEAAIEALRGGILVPQQRIVLLELILKVQTEQRQTENMLKTLQELLKTDAKLSYHQEKTLYLRLLVGSNMETVTSEASVLAESLKLDDGSYELLDALFAFRAGDRESLIEALEKIKVPEQFDPGKRAVYSGLLSVSGQPARAFGIAEKIPSSLLLDEEKRFLQLAL